MATQTIDLWPNDIGTNVNQLTPVAILKQQASLLGEKTKNLVEAEVSTSIEGDIFVHSFFLVAPALSRYRYLLFRIIHNVDPYPLSITGDPTNDPLHPTQVANSDDEFVERLKEVFSSERTKKVIGLLIAQSQGTTTPNVF